MDLWKIRIEGTQSGQFLSTQERTRLRVKQNKFLKCFFFQFSTAPTNIRLKAHSPLQTPQHPIRTAMPICQSNALMASVSARVCAIPFFYNFHFICSSNSNKSGSTERAGERQQHLGCRTREIAANSTQRSGCGTEGIQARQAGEEASAAEQNGGDTTPSEEAIGTEVVLNGRSDVMNWGKM